MLFLAADLAVCFNVPQHLDEEAAGGINEIAQQLAFSDLILLNKIDLVDHEQVDIVKSAVRRINKSANLVECKLNQETGGSRPPLSLLLDSNSFNVNKALQVDPDFLQSDSGTDLEDSSSDYESDSEEGGVEGGGATADTAGGTAANAAAGEAEASTAAQQAAGACCDGHHHQHKKQRIEQPGGTASVAAAQTVQQQQQQADSQVTSQTVGPCAADLKRLGSTADDSSAAALTKVGAWYSAGGMAYGASAAAV